MNQTVLYDPLTAVWDSSAPLRVLILEENSEDAHRNVEILKRDGFDCRAHVISTYDEFAAQVERFPYDIVLAAYRLPGWTGMDAFEALRQAGRDVPFILVTGVLGEEVAVECIRQGITDCVLKRSLARLPMAVTRALEAKALSDARTFTLESLRRSELNSLFLFLNNPLPMWIFDRSSLQILQVNDAAVAHYGYDRAMFLQMSARELHPPQEIPQLLSTLGEDSPRPYHTREWHHRLSDSTNIDVELFVQHMDYSGSSAALVVALDITERKRAEESRQKFFTLVENSRDFIAVADLHGNMQYVNPAGRKLLGIASPEAVIGTRTINYVAQVDLSFFRKKIAPAIKSKGHWEGELRIRNQHTGQALPVDFVGFQVTDLQTGEPRFVATVSRDMAERRALEQQLRHAQKFEAIGHLAGGIAHDFNNVIGAILGWAELGEEQAAGNEQLSAYFKKITSQCDRVTGLIRQLLTFARRQVLEPRIFSLNQTVQDILSLLDGVIGKDIELDTDLEPKLSVVRADPTQIEQVLMNLCVNSRDAMQKGGKLSIQTRNTGFTQAELHRNPELQTGQFAELRVRDTGTGMSADVRERIFEPFFTTKESGKGTGLGLATVYGIVKQHGGFIQVESEPGQGCTFRIFLPVHEAAHKAAEKVIVDDRPIRGGTETILIAEDHQGIREMASAALQSFGYHVLIAHDGEEAVRLFSDHREEVALVLLDVIMPHRSGHQVHAAISALKPGIPAIFVTGYNNESAALADIVGRGITILKKPYRPRTLCRKVREALDRGNPVTQSS